VHHVLAQAPAWDAAFQAGSLGWTALRSLARLERIEDTDACVPSCARGGCG